MEVAVVLLEAVNFDHSRKSGRVVNCVIAEGVYKMGRGERVVLDQANVQGKHEVHHRR